MSEEAKRRGSQPGAKQVRWTKLEWRELAAETFKYMQLATGDFRTCGETAQDFLISSGAWPEHRRRNGKFLNKSMAPQLVKEVDKLRELAAARLEAAQAAPVFPPEEAEPPEQPEPPEEEPQEQPEPEPEPLPAAARPQPASWGAEERQTAPRAAEVIGSWIGATLSAALSRPEVQEAISTCFFSAFQRVIPALSELAAQLIPAPPPAPAPVVESVVNDPGAWIRAQAKKPQPVEDSWSGEPANGTAMESALQKVGYEKPQDDDDPPPPKIRVHIVGPTAHERERLLRDFGKRLDLNIDDPKDVSKDTIRAHCKSADYVISTMPHSGSPIDAILKTNITDEKHYFRIPQNKVFLRERLDRLASGMSV